METIRLDGDTQPRNEIDLEVVADYAEAYANKVEMPPLIVFFDGTDYWLGDGFHRWHAAKKAELDKLRCEVRQGTREDARWFSYSANQTHGLRRSNADKARSVKAALRHPKAEDLSDGQLAEHVGVSDRMVAKYRREAEPTPKDSESTHRTGRDGRTINTANIGKRAEPEADDEYENCPDCGGTDFFEDGKCAACVPDEGEAPSEPVLDANGKKVPEAFREIFATRKEYRAIGRELEGLFKRGEVLAKSEAGTWLDWIQFRTSIKDAKHAIKFGAPFVPCRHCRGDGCRTCRQSGFLNQRISEKDK